MPSVFIVNDQAYSIDINQRKQNYHQKVSSNVLKFTNPILVCNPDGLKYGPEVTMEASTQIDKKCQSSRNESSTFKTIQMDESPIPLVEKNLDYFDDKDNSHEKSFTRKVIDCLEVQIAEQLN